MKPVSTNYGDFWFNYCVQLDPNKIKKVIRQEYVTSNKTRIHLDVYDNDPNNSNPTILFIHGTALYCRFYAEFLYTLYEKGFRVIGMDLQGHGLSGGCRGHFSMEELTSTIYDVVSHIREKYSEKVVMIGSSLVGIVTLYSAANDPRLTACVCVNASILNEKAHKDVLNLKGIIKLASHFVPLAAKVAPKMRFSVFKYLNPIDLVKMEDSKKMIPLVLEDEIVCTKYSLKSLATQLSAPLAKPIEEIVTPIMILNGTEDVLYSVEYIQRIFERLESSKNKKLLLIENGPHVLLTEKRDECISGIMNWFNEIFP